MELNGNFSTESATTGNMGGVDIGAWEKQQGRRDQSRVDLPEIGIEELGRSMTEGQREMLWGDGTGANEELGVVVDEAKGVKVGMGENDLRSVTAEKADAEFREANKLLDSYGWAVNKVAGRGADPVTDNEVVKELYEKMKTNERDFKRTGDIEGFYERFANDSRTYRLGDSAKVDSEVAK